MKCTSADLRTCLNIISAIILVVGLGTAIYIYQTADSGSSGALGYQILGGSVYPIMPENSKIYKHDLELYGGKAVVLADEFRRWFIGLWHGKSLAFTVAFISIFISFGFFFAANYMPPSLKSDVRNENDRNGTD
jgi:hypothetical protein